LAHGTNGIYGTNGIKNEKQMPQMLQMPSANVKNKFIKLSENNTE